MSREDFGALRDSRFEEPTVDPVANWWGAGMKIADKASRPGGDCGLEGRGLTSSIGGCRVMTTKAEELAVLYAEFDRQFACLERLIWRIRELQESG